MDNKKVLVVKPVLENNNINLDFSTESFVDYLDMRTFVNGPIELLAIPIVIDDNSYDIFLNEEGKLIGGLLPSIVLLNDDKVYDIVVGNFFVSKSNYEGESVDMSNDEINKIKEFINNNMDSFIYQIDSNNVSCRLLKMSY